MKNRFLKLLTLFMVAGSLFVGCGGSEVGTETGTNNSSGTDTNTEANVNDEVVSENNSNSDTESSLATIQTGLEYIEGEYYFCVPGEEYLDTTYADGETLDTSSWESIGKLITIQESINIFDGNKNIMGYFKPGVELIYMSTNGEWSRIALGTDLINFNGTVIVRTEDLEKVADIEGAGVFGTEMSDEARAYFDKIRNGVIEDNKTIEEYAAEHPEVSVWYLEEADSLEGMELVESCVFNLNEEGYAVAMDVIRQFVYNKGYSKYYIEYIGESNDLVEFNIYGGK